MASLDDCLITLDIKHPECFLSPYTSGQYLGHPARDRRMCRVVSLAWGNHDHRVVDRGLVLVEASNTAITGSYGAFARRRELPLAGNSAL